MCRTEVTSFVWKQLIKLEIV